MPISIDGGSIDIIHWALPTFTIHSLQNESVLFTLIAFDQPVQVGYIRCTGVLVCVF